MSVPNLFAEPKETEAPDKKFLKRIDELIDESELEAMAEIDKQIRSKNTKSALILMTLIGLAAILYLGIQNEMVPGLNSESEVASTQPATTLPESTPESTTSVPVAPETSSMEKEAQVVPPPTPMAEDKSGVDMEEQAIKAISQALINLDESETATDENNTVPETLVAIEEPAPKKEMVPEMEEVPAVKTPAPGNYYVQVGAFSVKSNADRMVTRLQKAGMTTQISINEGKASLYTVYIGGFNSPQEADYLLNELQRKGYSVSLVPDGEKTYALVLEKSTGKAKAEKLQAKLGRDGIFTNVKQMKVSTPIYVVRVGGFASDSVAKEYQKKLESLGYAKTLVRNIPNQT